MSLGAGVPGNGKYLISLWEGLQGNEKYVISLEGVQGNEKIWFPLGGARRKRNKMISLRCQGNAKDLISPGTFKEMQKCLISLGGVFNGMRNI